jgi:two-component system chemotaxis response regulator CheB
MPQDRAAKRRNIVVIGGSAGSLVAGRAILDNLRHDIPAALFVVQHTGTRSGGPVLAWSNSEHRLPIQAAVDGSLIRQGQVQVCVPGFHLVLGKDKVRLSMGPRENCFRPAIDPLFRTAAAHHQGRVIAVLLSGYLADGVAGLGAVRRCGGLTVVQDPDDALTGDMPRNALKYHEPDYVRDAKGIADLINQLAGQPAPEDKEVPEDIILEARMAVGQELTIETEKRLGRRTPYACPDCSGSLWEVDEALRRYRCHIGHAYTSSALAEAQSYKLDAALWSALRGLRERARLLRQMAEDARAKARGAGAETYDASAEELEEQAAILHDFILGRSKTATLEPEDAVRSDR